MLAVEKMHVKLLRIVVRWPMMRFDTTPLGRVLHRFAIDMEIMDNHLPPAVRDWLMAFCAVNLNPNPFVPSSLIYFLFFHFNSTNMNSI